MKKILLLTAMVVSCLTKLQAQDSNSGTDAKNTIKVNPLSLILRTGSVFYEHKLAENSSFQMGVAFTGMKVGDVNFNGFALTPEYRFYPKKNALSGLYLAPYVKYQNYTLKADGSKGTYSSFGGGLLLGRQWVYKSDFTLDLFFGPSYNNGDIKVKSGDEEDLDMKLGIDGFGIRTGITLGFGF